jgi:hypothetical protein
MTVAAALADPLHRRVDPASPPDKQRPSQAGTSTPLMRCLTRRFSSQPSKGL